MRNACTNGYFLVSGGTKSMGICPAIAAVQPGLPMHSGATGFKFSVACECAALVTRLLSTPRAADTGRHSTEAGLPGVEGRMLKSTRSPLTKIGLTSNWPLKLKG